jgi:hypothetical protein
MRKQKKSKMDGEINFSPAGGTSGSRAKNNKK